MKYDLSRIEINGDTAIRCDTYEKAIALLNELDKRKYEWNDGRSIKDDNVEIYEQYLPDLCFVIGKYKRFLYSDTRACLDAGKDIVDFDDLLTHQQRHFSTGAVRDSAEGKGRYDLLPMFAIHELAKAMEKGAEKYGERNIDKGIPQYSLVDSGMRHLTQYIRGDKDEKHLVSALWNIAWAVQQDEIKPEMNDLPWTKEEWFE